MVAEQEKQGLHILVAVKGVKISESPVRLAVSVLRSTGGRATLFMPTPEGQRRSQVDAILERYAAIFDPYPVDFCIRPGRVFEEIAKEAACGDYDLAIIGQRPENLLLKYLFTHAAGRAIYGMTCPVLIASGPQRPLRRFLVCEGGRSTKILPALTGRLTPLTSKVDKILILHVMSQITASPGIRGWELRADAEELIDHHTPEGERLEYDLSALHQLQVDVSVKVRHGVVVEEILAEAESGDFDLIVLGVPQVTGWQRFLLDNPVHKIILNSPRPVMVVG